VNEETTCILLVIALMMAAASTSETPVNFYQTIRRNNPEDSCLHIRRRENLKSHLMFYMFSVSYSMWIPTYCTESGHHRFLSDSFLFNVSDDPVILFNFAVDIASLNTIWIQAANNSLNVMCPLCGIGSILIIKSGCLLKYFTMLYQL
jgi:hypothetical protein